MRKRIPNVSRFIGRLGFALVVFGVALSIRVSASPAKTSMPSSSYWIANTGQWEGDFQYKCEVGNAVYYVTPKGMTVDFREFHRYPKAQDQYDPMDRFDHDREQDSMTVSGHVVQIHHVGAGSKLATGDGLLSHYSNYFLGRDSTNWRSRVPHYQTVIANEVWPGINVEYRADKQGVETIYHVFPGVDPTQILIDYIGLDAPLQVDSQGNLVLTTSLGEVKEQAPYAYQMDGRTQKRIESTYRILDNNRVAFEFEGFDASKELVIDPLLYGTYLGGESTDYGGPLTPAPDGGVYVTGMTYALSGFPTTPGAYDETGIFPGYRPFVSHFGVSGEFLASTLFGEIQTSENRNTEAAAYDMVYDSSRSALWMCGVAYPDWPLTPDAFDTTIGSNYDSFLLLFSEGLDELLYCTYLGGNGGDQAKNIRIDDLGRIYIAGGTSSTDFPLTPDAIFSAGQEGEGFIWIFDFETRSLVFSTYFGGEANDDIYGLSMSPNGHIWLCGKTNSAELPVTDNAYKTEFSDTGMWGFSDAFLALITLNPPTVEYCSYIGGSGTDELTSIVERDSIVFLVGRTFSNDFPVTPGAADTIGPVGNTEGFVARLNWEIGYYTGTFIGGNNSEYISVSGHWVGEHELLVCGTTRSSDFPVTSGAYDTLLNNNGTGSDDGFVLKINHGLSEILYSTYIGGSAGDEYQGYVVNSNNLWLTGTTQSFDLPTTPDAFQPNDNALNSGFVQHFAIDTTADTTNAAEHGPMPFDFNLKSFPNPFNSSTTLSFALPKSARTELIIHNILGQEIEHADLGRMNTGQHRKTVGDPSWASGIYIVTLKTRASIQSTKILLIR